ncbi:hypothetical protein ALC57_02278 [Trachymyrmex cornetzi]|uniref:Single domain-containing protein n=1 Tax=Trachymyrmex cornetzi TaxID=471704 RepID=A0A195EIY9_9HYME|nr:hypothetical protein ALC57_02278 [Trachymyrmex cornetzi]
MKSISLFCIFLLFVHYSMQVPKYENCNHGVLPEGDQQRCIKVTCTSRNKFTIEECNCEKNAGQHLGEHNSEYPVCCPQCSRSNKLKH